MIVNGIWVAGVLQPSCFSCHHVADAASIVFLRIFFFNYFHFFSNFSEFFFKFCAQKLFVANMLSLK